VFLARSAALTIRTNWHNRALAYQLHDGLMSQDMNSDVYIFGYQSILAAGSLDTSVGTGEANQQAVPARLEGYVRCWRAVRNFVTNETKRYVHTDDWRVAERVAFATLIPRCRKTVNGLCWRISGNRLAALDFREQGYRRIDVSQGISPYNNYELDKSIPCYTYVDPTPDRVPAVVSRSYYDMGRMGAASINNLVPEFLADYLSSTVLPTIFANDLAFVFFSGDGHQLWLLEESDSSLVLLHRFALPQLTPLTRDSPESLRHITPGLEWLDARHRALLYVSNNRRVPSGMVRDLLLAANGEDASTSPYWLCRLVAADSALISASRLNALTTDSDFWVRRAAQFRKAAHIC
jgi:hypothetical protein